MTQLGNDFFGVLLQSTQTNALSARKTRKTTVINLTTFVSSFGAEYLTNLSDNGIGYKCFRIM